MLLYIAGYTYLYRLVQVYRILREMAIECQYSPACTLVNDTYANDSE
jgi:hypothetical protein